MSRRYVLNNEQGLKIPVRAGTERGYLREEGGQRLKDAIMQYKKQLMRADMWFRVNYRKR